MNILNKTNPIRLLTAVSLLLMLALPLSAQEKQELKDSVFTFRFIPGKDMFFAPGMNNGNELTRLFDYVERYKDMINSNKVSLLVDGYFISKGKKADKRNIAKIRSNRVKSELITRKGLKEVNFSTRNQPGHSNFVTVRFNFLDGSIQPKLQEDNATQTKDDSGHTDGLTAETENISIATDTIASESGENAISETIITDQVTEVADSTDFIGGKTRGDSPFALKTNLLGYAVLMPNLEIEWMFTKRWSVALEGQGAWYSKGTPHKVYRLATLTPEFRFWAIERSRWHGMYVGIFGGAGLYDLSNGKKGHEGEGWMAGVSAGYVWPISRHLSLDAGIGAGYLRARDKVYAPLDGHYLYQLTKNINYFGPLRLKLSLVWRIPK